jgi:hypothetical protein
MKESNPYDGCQFLVPTFGSSGFNIFHKVISKYDKKQFCMQQNIEINNDEQLKLYLKEYEIL